MKTVTHEKAVSIKDKLDPIVQSTLDAYCGNDCAGFQIGLNFERENQKSTRPTIKSDLGFGPPRDTAHDNLAPPMEDPVTARLEAEQSTALKSVTVEILNNPTLTEAKRSNIMQLVQAKVANAAQVPTVISFKALSTQASINPFPFTSGAQQLQSYSWPLTLILCGLLVSWILAKWITEKRILKEIDWEIEKEKLQLLKETQTASEKIQEVMAAPLSESELPKSWLAFIEHSARWDLVSLDRTLGLVEPGLLLNTQTLSTEASLLVSDLLKKRSNQPASLLSKEQRDEGLNWLKMKCAEIHLIQMRAEQDFKYHLSLWTDREWNAVSQKLKNPTWRALLWESSSLNRVTSDSQRMSELDKTETIRFGLSMSPETRSKIRGEFMNHFGLWPQIQSQSSADFVLKASLILDPKAFQNLLAEQSLSSATTSQGWKAALQKMDDDLLVETCLAVDTRTLAWAFHGQTDSPILLRLMKLLPKNISETLKRELSSVQSHVDPSNTRILGARSRLGEKIEALQ